MIIIVAEQPYCLLHVSISMFSIILLFNGDAGDELGNSCEFGGIACVLAYRGSSSGRRDITSADP